MAGSDVSKAVYNTADICALFGISKNFVDSLIESKTIPKPLPTRARGRKIWSKAKVDRALGLTEQPQFKTDLRREILDLLRDEMPGLVRREIDDLVSQNK